MTIIVQMPAPVAGYAACRSLDHAKLQITHLVELDEHGSNGGRPTVCGLDRFPPFGTPAQWPPTFIASWSIGGGLRGPDIAQLRCIACWQVADPADLQPLADNLNYMIEHSGMFA